MFAPHYFETEMSLPRRKKGKNKSKRKDESHDQKTNPCSSDSHGADKKEQTTIDEVSLNEDTTSMNLAKSTQYTFPSRANS